MVFENQNKDFDKIREMENEIKIMERIKYQKKAEFFQEFQREKKLAVDFPWFKQKRSISLLNNLEEYLEMQNYTKQNISKLEKGLNVSKLNTKVIN